MAITYLTLAWIGGILFATHSESDLPFGLGAVAFALWFVVRRDHAGERMTVACAMFFMLGGLRLIEAQPEQNATHVVQYHNGDFVSIEGVIGEEPDVRETVVNLRVEVEEILWLGKYRQAEGSVLVQAPTDMTFAYGDRILATGMLRPPPELDDFSYRDYLARRRIFSQMRPDRIQITGHNQGQAWQTFLLETKSQAQHFIQDALPEPQGSLLAGILLGDDSGLARSVQEAFNATGTSHVIAISGFNMTLIAGVVAAFLSGLLKNKNMVFIITTIVLVVYTIFVGASPAVIRATVMSLLLIGAPLVRRKTYVPASLAFAALIMSLLDPYVLWDIGFQLSFAAVLGMSLLTTPFNRRFQRWMTGAFGESSGKRIAGILAEPLVVTFVAQLSTLPIILFYFGRLSIVSPLVNLLIIPAQPLVLILGALATLLSFIYAPLGSLFYQAGWLFLTWTVEIVRYFGSLPLADTQFSISGSVLVSFAMMAVIFALLNATRPLWFERLWKQRGKTAGKVLRYAPLLAAIILLGGIGQTLVNQPDGDLHVYFLNMGQSQSVLMQTPNGGVILVDGGRFPNRLMTALDDHLPAQKRQIDVLFISNDERDSIEALHTLLEEYRVEVVITGVEESIEPLYNTLIQKLKDKGTQVLAASAGWRTQTGDGVEIRLLAPVPEQVKFLVLRVQYKQAVFLLPTSLVRAEETSLIQQPHLIQATVLQATDYAAFPASNSEDWIAAVNPQVVIIQNDPSRSNGIAADVLERLKNRRLYRTDVHGLIEVRTDGQTLYIQTEY